MRQSHPDLALVATSQQNSVANLVGAQQQGAQKTWTWMAVGADKYSNRIGVTRNDLTGLAVFAVGVQDPDENRCGHAVGPSQALLTVGQRCEYDHC